MTRRAGKSESTDSACPLEARVTDGARENAQAVNPRESTALPFNELPLEIDLVGGKAANLAAMTRAGVAVPPGFCLTTVAYRQFISMNNLKLLLDETLQNLDSREYASLERAAEVIREAFLQGEMPANVREELFQAYRQLGSPPVAVRSSATREDQAAATFAGQHETFLNTIGEAALERKVRECWASLYSPGAELPRRAR